MYENTTMVGLNHQIKPTMMVLFMGMLKCTKSDHRPLPTQHTSKKQPTVPRVPQRVGIWRLLPLTLTEVISHLQHRPLSCVLSRNLFSMYANEDSLQASKLTWLTHLNLHSNHKNGSHNLWTSSIQALSGNMGIPTESNNPQGVRLKQH